VWNDSSGATGSGCSVEFAQPTFQATFLASHTTAFGTCKKRATNDVSAAAEFTPSTGTGGGIAEYTSTQQGFEPVVGTSAATPLVAAILTRLGLAVQVSSDLGFVYENIAAFNDVTSGDNDPEGKCSDAVMCNAGTGYDGPTGVGTPNGALLAPLGTGGSSSGGSSSGSSSGSGSDDGGVVSDDAGGSSSGGSSSGGSSSGSSSSGSSSGGSSSGGTFNEDSGAPGEDGGSSGGNGFGGSGSGGGSSGGCSTSPADAPAPLQDAVMALMIGALALIGVRRRK
jgi:MYXO-CTERM domain-containing protein